MIGEWLIVVKHFTSFWFPVTDDRARVSSIQISVDAKFPDWIRDEIFWCSLRSLSVSLLITVLEGFISPS